MGKLPEDLRQANIAQAAGIGDKMEAINAIVVPESAGAPEFRFTDEEVECLAEQEHERWMRDGSPRAGGTGRPATTGARSTPTCSPGPPSAWPIRTRTATRSARLPGTLRDAGFQILRLPPDS